MATLDDGVVNLQRFVANLANATSALGQVDDYLGAKARSFTELENEAADEGDGLSGHLEDAGSALDTGKGEVTDALGDLAQAATDGQQALGEAEDKVEQAASDLEEKVQTALTDLDEANTSLTDEGFQALGHTLDEAEQELQAESQETEQAFTELETAVHGFETEAQTAWDDAEHELETATSELGEGESTIETEGSEGVHAFETAATEMETHCAALEGDLELIYHALSSGVEAQGHEWEQAVQNVAREAVGFAQDGQQQRLDDPATMLDDDALGSLDQEYTTLAAVLDMATAIAGELEPLGEELVKCQAVVVEVDELMSALAG
jgi:methyl-accepting chemotaxis protein